MEKQATLQHLAADPGFLLSRVGAAVRAGFRDVLAGWGIRPLQYVILLILDARAGLSQQELCTAASIDSGNMVELLDGLETLRYVQRDRDARDRRRHVVTITPRGQSALAELRNAVESYNGRVLSPLTGPEREQLAAALAKLFAATAQARPGPASRAREQLAARPAAGRLLVGLRVIGTQVQGQPLRGDRPG